MTRILPKSLQNHWESPHGLIQVFSGPRQVGKTTAAQALATPGHYVYASADVPLPPTTDFIVEHWERARSLRSSDRTLILDEVQKIPRWSEVVKKLWDEDKWNKKLMRVCLLGSSAMLIEKGLSESLTGRFETNYFPHWIFAECQRTFSATIEEYVHLGGYPKVYDLRDDQSRLENYIQNSIVEPTLGRDILVMHSVEKPALLRQLFWYVSRMPAQIVSYEKILGHLQGRGNAATLVHYAELLATAFIVIPISKFSGKSHRTKKSIPKWILPNPALVDPEVRREGLSGFVLENLVGSHLLNLTFGDSRYRLRYWREDNREIDYILVHNNEPILAVEVKSGRNKGSAELNAFSKTYPKCKTQIVTRDILQNWISSTSLDELLEKS
jgi:predicted AAA+ superfamily ATPase